MTSKKALERIIVGTNVDTHRSSIEEIDKAISLIEKDLEILEILKNESDSKRIIERDGIVSFHLDMILTSDNYNKIKEWLDE